MDRISNSSVHGSRGQAAQPLESARGRQTGARSSFKRLKALALGLSMLVSGLMVSTSASAAKELEGVTLRIAVDPMAAPYTFLDDSYTKPYGIDIEIIQELQKRLGFKIADERIYPLTTGYEIAALQRGDFDMIGGCLTMTKDRAQFMDFSPVYYDTGMSMMFSTKFNPDAKTVKSFNNSSKKIVVVAGTSGEQLVHAMMDKAQLIKSDNFTLAVFMVAKGQADGMIYQRPLLYYLTSALTGYGLEMTNEVFDREYGQLAFGFRQNSPYTKPISRELALMLIDGTISKIVLPYMDNPVARESIRLATVKAKQYLVDQNLGHLITDADQPAEAADTAAVDTAGPAVSTAEPVPVPTAAPAAAPAAQAAPAAPAAEVAGVSSDREQPAATSSIDTDTLASR